MEGSATSTTLREEYDAFLGYHPSVPPLDIRLGLTSIPSASTPITPLRWGILATGKVAHDFCQILKFLPPARHEISAVGSRSPGRARDFANLHSIPRAHGSYSDLCSDPDVDVIYVASLHPDHRAHAELALNGGKHVLVEKPMTMTAEDAEALYSLGERLDLFVGEGMWTRFFPAVEWARMRLDVGIEGNVGACRVVQADFSIDGDDVGPYPEDTIYSLEHGGGTAWTMGPYVVSASMLPFRRSPDRISANGIVPDEDGVGELAVGMTLTFDSTTSDDERGGGTGGSIASCLVGYLAESSETTMYAGKGGRVTLWGPAHCPTSATLTRKNGGRGNGAVSESGNNATAGNNVSTSVEFPLPPSIPSIEESGGIRMPNSMGFIYEAEAVRRLISAGLLTFPQWTPEESMGCIRTIESVLQQINK